MPSDKPQYTGSATQTAGLHSLQTAPAPLPSEHLLQGKKIVGILHNGSLYKLQATKLGKLILTK